MGLTVGARLRALSAIAGLRLSAGGQRRGWNPYSMLEANHPVAGPSPTSTQPSKLTIGVEDECGLVPGVIVRSQPGLGTHPTQWSQWGEELKA
jgi:hypothetical protein